MKITNIKQQVKNTERYSIYIDNKYSFSLNASELLNSGLKKGQELKSGDLELLDDQAQISKAKNSSFNLLSYRPRSRWEISSYLTRKKYDPAIIEATLDYLTTQGFINDEEFAKQWVSNRLAIRHASVIQIKTELRSKRISNEIISKVLEAEDIDELEQIKILIEKKRTQPKYQDDLKLMQFLSRRGFSYDKIVSALGRR